MRNHRSHLYSLPDLNVMVQLLHALRGSVVATKSWTQLFLLTPLLVQHQPVISEGKHMALGPPQMPRGAETKLQRMQNPDGW